MVLTIIVQLSNGLYKKIVLDRSLSNLEKPSVSFSTNLSDSLSAQ